MFPVGILGCGWSGSRGWLLVRGQVGSGVLAEEFRPTALRLFEGVFTVMLRRVLFKVMLCAGLALAFCLVQDFVVVQDGWASCPPSFTAGYVIVCEDDHWSLMCSYIGFYNNVMGLQVHVASLREVRSCYPGLSDSSAIRTYLEACWVASDSTLKYVLLVGRNVPPYYFSPRMEQLAAWDDSIPYDDDYGSFSKLGFCDVAVGRLPFGTATEISNYMSKVVELAQANPSAPWRKKALVLCDDVEMVGVSGAYAHALAESLSSCCIPSDWSQGKIFVKALPWWDLGVVQNQYVLPQFNTGHNLVVAIGSYSNVFDLVDCISTQFAGFTQSQLSNYGMYPVVLGGCCEVGMWDVPDQYGGKVGNLLLSAPGTGAIALVAPTSTTLQNFNYFFTRDLLQKALFDGQYQTWGDAFRAAKNAMVKKYPFAWDVWRECSFFGDPSISLRAYTVSVEESSRVPTSGNEGLFITYPNPFNPVVRFKFYLAASAKVGLNIFDVRGSLVKRMETRGLGPGYHEMEWDGKDPNGRPCSSGVYFSRLEIGERVFHGKLVLLR